MAEFRPVARLDQIPDIGGKEVNLDGRRICLFKHNGQVFATAAECPHKSAPMACGWVENGTVSCALHGWQFDLRSGECRNIPGERIPVFEVRLVGSEIHVAAGGNL
jgi:nitrite reductase/ring-hydroxylating ferredoxin subunit